MLTDSSRSPSLQKTTNASILVCITPFNIKSRTRIRRCKAAGARPPAQAARRKPPAAAVAGSLTLTLTLTLTLQRLDVAQHVSRFGQFADVAVSCSCPSCPRPSLSLLYCDSCPRHSTTLRTRLSIAQREGTHTGPTTSYLSTFFRP